MRAIDTDTARRVGWWRHFSGALADPFARPVVDWILAINAVFGSLGFYWYRYQLPATPVSLWLFVPDCPLYAVLMAVALASAIAGRRREWFETIVFLNLVKYGLWTVTVLALYWAGGGAVTAEAALLFLGHLGMFSEGIVYSRQLAFRAREVAVGVGWLFLNDYVDYFQATAPWLPNPAHIGFVRPFTFALSGAIASVAILAALAGSRQRKLGEEALASRKR